jgi:hypothetical protein
LPMICSLTVTLASVTRCRSPIISSRDIRICCYSGLY